MFTNWKMKVLLLVLSSVLLFSCLELQASEVPDENSGLSEEMITEEEVVEPQPLNLNVQNRQQHKQQRDPFAVTSRLRRAAASVENSILKPLFKPLKTAEITSSLPPMHLRGLVRIHDGGLAALLEINGETASIVHVVRAGDTIGLHEFGIDSVIQVVRINRLHLVIEAGTLGKLIIVR